MNRNLRCPFHSCVFVHLLVCVELLEPPSICCALSFPIGLLLVCAQPKASTRLALTAVLLHHTARSLSLPRNLRRIWCSSSGNVYGIAVVLKVSGQWVLCLINARDSPLSARLRLDYAYNDLCAVLGVYAAGATRSL